MTNTDSLTLVFIKIRRQDRVFAAAKQVPGLELDETYEPMQVEEAMYIVRARVTAPLKHHLVFSSCPESDMQSLLGEMESSSSRTF